MPRGASPKREREYTELKSRFKQEGRYRGREEEVASRIVNKQRAQYGETKRAKAEKRRGQSPDKNLPIANYRSLTVPQVKSRIGKLDTRSKNRVAAYERKHKNRKSVLEAISDSKRK